MTTMDSIARHFVTSPNPLKPVYALVRVAPLATDPTDRQLGDVKTWSLSRAAMRRAREKEWNPEHFRIVKMTLQGD